MLKFNLECVSQAANLNVYADAEFAAIMWQEVESDDTFTESSDEVTFINMKFGDKYEVEWMGFEWIEGEKVTCVKLDQRFGNTYSTTFYKHPKPIIGWVPASKFKFLEGTQDGIKITRI